jgi:hypothetical protein
MEKIGLVSQNFNMQIHFEEQRPSGTHGMLYAVTKFNGLCNNSVNSLAHITLNGTMN